MTIEYLNCDQNVSITDTVTGTNTSIVFDTRMPYRTFVVQVTPTGGSVTVYTSNDKVNWDEWVVGAVTDSTVDTCDPVCYIKVTNTTSTSTAVAIWGTK